MSWFALTSAIAVGVATGAAPLWLSARVQAWRAAWASHRAARVTALKVLAGQIDPTQHAHLINDKVRSIVAAERARSAAIRA